LPGANVDLRNKTREIYPTQTTGDDLDPLNQKCGMWHALEEANELMVPQDSPPFKIIYDVWLFGII
jgi:hypothetical protein